MGSNTICQVTLEESCTPVGRLTGVLVMDPAVPHDLAPLGHELGAPGEH